MISCSAWQPLNKNVHNNSISHLHFIGSYVIPYNFKFDGTTVGGLSGIDYNPARREYYMISDDRSEFNPARFYTAKIFFSSNKINSVQFTKVTFLRQANGKTYPNSKTDPFHTPDPEALRYDKANHTMIWSSEGERVVRPGDTVLEDPAITEIAPGGNFKYSFGIPPQLHMTSGNYGPRQNLVFEGVAFANHDSILYVSVENPLYQDGPRASLKKASTYNRILKYNLITRKPVAQYAYLLDPVAHAPLIPNSFMINGISDIMSIGPDELLTIERSFSLGVRNFSIRLYLTNLRGATNISKINSLIQDPPAHPAEKKLLLNMDSLGVYIDNIEGVTFGPDLPNGHRTLLFIADNNFSFLQQSQVLLFEVIP
jgi:hypothetical protein